MNSYSAGSKADILIVDDTLDNIRLLSTMLLEQGYSVRKALNGHLAITAARTLLPDLILLDINMPDMNGYEVCKKLKEDVETCSVPIIFLSALDNVADKVNAFQAGGVDYITKPFQFGEVLARIQTQLTLRNLQLQLQEKNEALQQTLDELRKTQLKLIQQEKMISLGQLIAGLSHEINNPISFIGGNLAPAREYFQSLVNLIQTYQQEFPEPTPAVEAAIQATDMEFLVPDLHKLLNSMQAGVERIYSIMLAFRIFSRLGEVKIKHVDIHEGIDSALLFLRHRLERQGKSPDIQVIKQYGDIPMVACYASQVNQAFLSLLSNAIDALEVLPQDPESIAPPTLWIQTAVTPEQMVQIRIKDNGPGISEAVQSRIFDPFYTTKPIGGGKGLGLAISYEIIVEKHKGQLFCNSSPGQGTEFVVEIPMNADAGKVPAFVSGN